MPTGSCSRTGPPRSEHGSRGDPADDPSRALRGAPGPSRRGREGAWDRRTPARCRIRPAVPHGLFRLAPRAPDDARRAGGRAADPRRPEARGAAGTGFARCCRRARGRRPLGGDRGSRRHRGSRARAVRRLRRAVRPAVGDVRAAPAGSAPERALQPGDAVDARASGPQGSRRDRASPAGRPRSRSRRRADRSGVVSSVGPRPTSRARSATGSSPRVTTRRSSRSSHRGRTRPPRITRPESGSSRPESRSSSTSAGLSAATTRTSRAPCG